jgi:hypothetical protein
MSLSHETVLELMSLADGELEGDDKDRVEKLVASSEEARQVLESMRRAEVGAWLSATMDERAARGGADGIADAVMSAVERGRKSGLEKASASNGATRDGGIVSIASGRARKSSRVQMVLSAGAAGLALAAAVALYVRAGSDRTADHAPVASVDVPPVATVTDQVPPSGGVEVNEIDAPSRGVSVFEIPVAAAAAVASPQRASSVVVWVDDDPGSK